MPTIFYLNAHFNAKRVRLKKKAHFLGIKQSTSVLVQIKKNCFYLLQFAANFLLFQFFFAAKTLKMTISTNVWSAQHPNTGRNIQHLQTPILCIFFLYFFALFLLFSFIDKKVVKMLKKIISTSKRGAKNLFNGKNTQHPSSNTICFTSHKPLEKQKFPVAKSFFFQLH